MKAYIELRTNIKGPKLKVEVETLDYKTHFGRKMCLVTPVKGEGKIWVNQDKIKVIK